MDMRSLGFVVFSTAAVYIWLLVLLRTFGRTQLAQLNVVNMTVVLVLGSAVETAMIHGDVSLSAGVVSAATLLLLDALLTRALLRSDRLRHMVNGGPILLVHRGRVVPEHLRRAGLSEDDLLAALRARGADAPERVASAVLETDGTISVVAND
jgi:uncharacterized membrane protein YcaP (DUF421 family)